MGDVDGILKMIDSSGENLSFTIADETAERRPFETMYAFWLERRPRFINDEEIKAAINRGEFDHLVPKFPVLGYDIEEGFGLGGRIPSRPLGEQMPTISVYLSKGGMRQDPMPVQFVVTTMPPWYMGRDSLVRGIVDQQGVFSEDQPLVVQGQRGVYYTTLGTQFGHTSHRWCYKGYRVDLRMMKPDLKLLNAFMECMPSDATLEDFPTRENAGPAMLRLGLEELRAAEEVLYDDENMILTDPRRPRGRFDSGIRTLQHLKDLWPITYGFQERRVALQKGFLNPRGKIWSWQGYIDGLTALRAETLAAITPYDAQVEQRGMVYVPKASREPYVTHAPGKLPPTWVLGPEK